MSAYCLRADRVDELPCASLERVGGRKEGEGRRVVGAAGHAAGVGDDGGELLHEGAKAVDGRAVLALAPADLLLRRGGAPGRGDRIAADLGVLILIGKGQLAPRLK